MLNYYCTCVSCDQLCIKRKLMTNNDDDSLVTYARYNSNWSNTQLAIAPHTEHIVSVKRTPHFLYILILVLDWS